MITHKPYSRAALQPAKFLSNVITITSETGVGSTTALKGLQAHFHSTLWRYVSGGGIMRAFAKQNGMTIEDFAAYNRAHPELGFDKRCDDTVAMLATHNYTLVEGRLPHAFVPHAFHVRLVCGPEVRAKRRQADSGGVPLDEIARRITKRDEDDNERYEVIYPGSLWRNDEFDLVVDTGVRSPDETVALILKGHEDWVRGQGSLIVDAITL